MKKILLTLLFLTSGYLTAEPCCSPECRKEMQPSPFYLGIFGGGNVIPPVTDDFIEISSYQGFIAGINAGVRSGYLRYEAEVAFRHNWVDVQAPLFDDSSIESGTGILSFMGNAYLDLFPQCCLYPYVGVGLGYSAQQTIISDDDDRHSLHEGHIAVQGIGGLAYKLDAFNHLSLEYRYFDRGGKLKHHSALLALKHFF